MKTFFLTLLCFASACFAEDIYVAQTAQGADNGTNAANAHSLSWFNTSTNWANNTSGKIGTGDVVHVVGTLTNNIVFQADGTSNNPITLKFESGAKFSSVTWTGRVITVTSGVIIDGGTNGLIEATSNGTGLSYSNNVYGIYGLSESYVTVKNLTFSNLYVQVAGPNQNAYGAGVLFGYSGSANYSNILVTNCVFDGMYIGVMVSASPSASLIKVSGITAAHCNWGTAIGDGGTGRGFTGVTIENSRFHSWTNWDDDLGTFHHNGGFVWATSGGYQSNIVISGNTYGPGYGAHNTSGQYLSGNLYNAMVYNNVFDASDNSSPADGQLYVFFNYGTNQSICRVFNNTFIGANAANFYNGMGTNVTYYYFYNNECYGCYQPIQVYYSTNNTLITDFNNFYGSKATYPFTASWTSSAWFKTFAQWQSVYGFDLNSTTNNPGLNSSYYPTNGSPLIGVGTNLYAYAQTDKDGNARASSGNWDVGAYVYLGNPTVTITSPANGSLTSTGTVSFACTVTAGSGGVTNVTWYTNGVSAGSATNLALSFSGTSTNTVFARAIANDAKTNYSTTNIFIYYPPLEVPTNFICR